MQIPSALILDRDGTIVAMVRNPRGERDSPYFASQIELYPELGNLLASWTRAGVPIFIATNQPGIAKGNFTRDDLAEFHRALTEQLDAVGVPVREILCCIHHPVGAPGGDTSLVGACDCRKPKPGMLLELRDKHGVDLSRAVMIGDSPVDVQAAEAAGVGTAVQVVPFLSPSLSPGPQLDGLTLADALSRFSPHSPSA